MSDQATTPIRVLLAEDDLGTQRMMRTLLTNKGYAVSVAMNGHEAIAAHELEPFDVILMDMQMPGMGGWQATVALREREETSGGHVPIVALTASTQPGDRETCLAAGMDGYVSKPIDIRELVSSIESLVRGKSAS